MLSLLVFGFMSLYSSSSDSLNTNQREWPTKAVSLPTPDSLDVRCQIDGVCFASSSTKNRKFTGVLSTGVLPRSITSSFQKNGLYLLIKPDEHSFFWGSILGCKLYLVNTSGTLATLRANEGKLYIVAEALTEQGEWQPITTLLPSDCGHSYYDVILDTNQYWSFTVPVFKGQFKTKVRYSLQLPSNEYTYSNEVPAYINIEQFNVVPHSWPRSVCSY